METHNYKRPREHGKVVELRRETYRLGVMKHGEEVPDEVEHGEIPILHRRKSLAVSGNLRCRTVMNSANTIEQLCEQLDIGVRRKQAYPMISSRTKRT